MSHQEGVGETVAPHPPRRRTSKKHNLPKKTALRRCTITAQPGQAHSEQTQTSSSRFLSWSRGVRLGLATYTLPAAAVHLIGAHSPAPLGGAVLLLSPVDEEQGGEDEHNRHRHAARQPDPDIRLQAYRKHTSVLDRCLRLSHVESIARSGKGEAKGGPDGHRSATQRTRHLGRHLFRHR